MDCFNFCSITLNYLVIIDCNENIIINKKDVTLHLPAIPINHYLIAVPTKTQVMEPIKKPNSSV